MVMQLGWLGGDLQPLSLSPSPRPPSAAKEGTLPPQLPACAPFVFSFVRGRQGQGGRGMERGEALCLCNCRDCHLRLEGKEIS